MSRKSRLSAAGAGLLSAMAVAASSHATVLAPGSTDSPDAFTAPAGATLVASDSKFWLSSPVGTSHGAALSAVFVDPSNVFCAGCLDFMYQIVNGDSFEDVNRVTAINFTGFSTDVGFVTNGSALPGGFFATGTVHPETVDRNSAGDVIGFNFPEPFDALIPGRASNVLIIETDAKNFEAGHATITDALGNAATVSAFEPAAAVPEPASWALMIAGAGAIGAALRLGRASSRRLVAA